MRTLPIALGFTLALLVAGLFWGAATAQQAQTGGDQVLDGISETDLIARYVLDNNANDRSRNSHNATVKGEGATFIDDAQFGRVLSLAGDKETYLELPKEALKDAENLSVSAWVNLNADTAAQYLFEFGKGAMTNLNCALTGNDAQRSLISRMGVDNTNVANVRAEIVPVGRWVHVAVAFDGTNKTLSLYVDGERVGRAENVATKLDQIVDNQAPDLNRLLIGSSQGRHAALNAKLRDFRIYTIALNDEQVATIRRNATTPGALAGGENRRGRRGNRGNRGRGNRNPTVAPPTAPSPYATLESVPEVNVETVVGTLPRLPEELTGTYRGNAQGPPVRVIWPAPRDNSEVATAGMVTIAGKIAGSDLQPKAIVTVKPAAAAVPAPKRSLEPFSLGQVVLNPMDNGQESQFQKNRDKFFRGLAATNPDSFLYLFRETFGQPQPEGTQALRGWDSQETRLRGHGTGHYLSAIAQAYASTSYDADLHADFHKKMNYMIDALYDLSQKSGKSAEPGGPANDDPTTVPPGAGREAYHNPPENARRGGGGGGGGGRGSNRGNAGYDIREGYDSHLTDVRTDYWNWGVGFISAYPPDQFIMLEKGATYGTGDNQIWAPYYTLHKILAGLLDCYEVGGNEKALEIAKGMGVWVHTRLKAVPTATRIQMWNTYIAGEYGGMNEVMARMYRLTKDERFLEGAKLFDNINFFYGDAERAHGLAKNVDTLRGKHANQHIPQITGALETYRDTNEPIYYQIADNFWDLATNHYAYSIGGVAGSQANGEAFTAEPDSLFTGGFANNAQNETCATYNMLKLTRQLFMYDQNAKFMDYYELALYNHILASVAENNAGNTYHVPLNPGAQKGFGNPNMTGFTCCNGTAIESSTKLQDSIYFKSADGGSLYVNLFVPSTLHWADKKVVVKQQTNFPYADSTKLTVNGANGTEIHVRVPDWATKGFTIVVNGSTRGVEAKPGSYLSLGRDWKDGDTIELKMPFQFRLERVMDQPNLASIFYGPVLLAAEETEARSNWRPMTLNAADLSKSISGDPSTLRFEIGDARLKPFYETYDRHSVYFDVTLE